MVEEIITEKAYTAKTKTINSEVKTAGTVKVLQYGSSIRRNKRQFESLKALGLGKINRVKELQDLPSVRGLIAKVAHMVKVID